MNQPPVGPVPWRTRRRLARKPRIALAYADLIRLPRPATNSLDARHWVPGATCAICGEAIRPWQAFNWDHDVPMSRGGAKGKKNKRLAHRLCNSVKGNRHPFSLRTPADRYTTQQRVSPSTWERLERIWRGEPG